jgi:hypothetical protein
MPPIKWKTILQCIFYGGIGMALAAWTHGVKKEDLLPILGGSLVLLIPVVGLVLLDYWRECKGKQ